MIRKIKSHTGTNCSVGGINLKSYYIVQSNPRLETTNGQPINRAFETKKVYIDLEYTV